MKSIRRITQELGSFRQFAKTKTFSQAVNFHELGNFRDFLIVLPISEQKSSVSQYFYRDLEI